MKEAPEEMSLAKLEVLAMPNGEILCAGKSIGFVSELGKYLSDVKPAL